MDLKKRCKGFICDTGVPVTQFCKHIKLSVSSYNRWQRDDLLIAESTQNRIDTYLKRFNY